MFSRIISIGPRRAVVMIFDRRRSGRGGKQIRGTRKLKEKGDPAAVKNVLRRVVAIEGFERPLSSDLYMTEEGGGVGWKEAMT